MFLKFRPRYGEGNTFADNLHHERRNEVFKEDRLSNIEDEHVYSKIPQHTQMFDLIQPESLKQECKVLSMRIPFSYWFLVSELYISSPEESPVGSLHSSTGL